VTQPPGTGVEAAAGRPAVGGLNAMRRRRFVSVLASACGLACLPGPRSPRAERPWRWQGSALGADARIDLWLDDPARARRLVRLCLAEIDRLERVFSLQRQDSALALLNRDGRLPRPPPELVTVLEAARRVAEASGGAFDATVQPLWRLHADHFARPGSDSAGPALRDLERLRPLIDHRGVDAEPRGVRLIRPGMAVTLNGIAQGFIADRLALLLQDQGLAGVLLDVGEIATVGPAPDGGDWPVRAGAGGPVLALASGAVATSNPAALAFDRQRRFSHLIDPATLRPCAPEGEVTVVADSATLADAVSTALAVRPACVAQEVPRDLGVRTVLRRPPAQALVA
jgi:thiamine biosynthesis lipoprotein